MNTDKYLVSVCVFTYNHEEYIEHCLESILMQQTTFKYEIIIGEDYSSDATRIICEKYARKFNNVRLLDRGHNLKLSANYYSTLQQATGKYTAIIDGDDYWIHPLKLQKQVDLLENDSNLNICFHQVIRINELDNNALTFFVSDIKDKFSFEDIVTKWQMATGSIMFRTKKMSFPPFLLNTVNFDLAIQMIVLSDQTFAGFINEIMSIYRINPGSNTNNTEYNDFNTNKRLIKLMNDFNEYTNFKFNKVILEQTRKLNSYLVKANSFSLYKHIKVNVKNVIKKFGYKISISKV